MRLRLAWLLVASVGCAGELVVEVGEDGTVTGPACSEDTDCPDGFRCDGVRCIVTGDGGGGGGGGGDGDGEPTLELGEECESAFECLSGRCEDLGSTQICTKGCTDVCDAGLICFDDRCVPAGFCEDPGGSGVGPGCTNSVCLACDTNATCVATADGFECRCNDGFSGSGTTCTEILCRTNPCQNGGQCVQVGDQESCSCADDDSDFQPDWTGEFCETPIQNCPIFVSPTNNPCQNGGVCSNTQDGLTCNCAGTGFSGDRCDTDVDECDGANPCENGGLCINETGGFDCDCPPDFVGETCAIDVSGGCAVTNPCSNGGVCDETSGEVQCICAGTGFYGDTCTIPIDDCDPDPCQNGAGCTDLVNDFECDCPLGFEGKDCGTQAVCADDVDCAAGQFCDVGDTGRCQPDACDPDADRRCDGNRVLQCTPNGSEEVELFTCVGRPGAFSSTCVDPTNDDAYCTCEDDWDCPANTVCDVDRCVGTGEPATCRLPAEPFSNVLPTQEIEWGAESISSRLAPVGTPFREFTQVVMTPVVANLDDDNDDGLINEKDRPEIIFLTFCWKPGEAGNVPDYRRDGVLRVIHGGGAERGEDHLAICGNQVWRDDGTGVATNASCVCNRGDDAGSAPDIPRFDPTMSPAVADIDGDGVPEIVVHNESDELEVYDNRGNLLAISRSQNSVSNGAVTIANIDNDGMAEIIIGRNVNFLSVNGNAWEFTDYFLGSGQRGGLSQGPAACVADIVGDEKMEILGGGTAYRVPEPPPGVSVQSACSGSYSGDAQLYCNEQLAEVWDTEREGFCSVADVYGADGNPAGPSNPLDGVPEIVLVGEADGETGNNGGGRMVVISNQGVVLDEYNYRNDRDLSDIDLGTRGGAPNVDDFDGDGFPEVGTAFSAGYALVDFQPPTAACPQWPDRLESTPPEAAPGSNPARTPQQVMPNGCDNDSQCEALVPGTACNEETKECICLHNSWVRRTEDDSSRLTGSSVFDFNGDGAAEVIYNDECEFRVYDGLTGNVLFAEPSESRTRIEYPVVADVDNDGNAEIVFGTSNESGFCSFDEDDQYNAGVEVWGDAGDFWVSARRMWNQHAYHVTNITENSQVPLIEPKGWLETNGRFYNTYRSNPRNFGVAPDLEVTAVQVVGGGGGCGGGGGGAGQIVSQISNIGDLRVGGNVVVGFQGDWGSGFVTLLAVDGTPLRTTVTDTLEPRGAVFLSTNYDPAWNGEAELPNEVRVFVDASYDEMNDMIAFDGGRERECDETNNDRTIATTGGASLPDLTITQLSTPGVCGSAPPVAITVSNPGSEPAPAGTVVRLYAGDPDQGGTALQDIVLSTALPPGASVTLNTTPAPFPQCRPIRIFAVVDPENAVEECNDGNNQRSASTTTTCCDTGG